MAPFSQGYRKMLYTLVLSVWLCNLNGPRKDAIDALREQIDSHFREIDNRRSAQNSHVPISGLPLELLSEVFLCIVESSIWYDDAYFNRGTFRFRQVCKHWNEVAIGFPQLWVRWVTGVAKAWPLFNERSKGALFSLTWRYYTLFPLCKDILKIPGFPGRIRRLDFCGSSKQLEHLFSAFHLSPPSNASFIRLRITHRYGELGSQDHLAHVLPFSFPKLSKLDIDNFRPDPLSPVFTTSNLTSLKLDFPNGTKPRYTLAQFSQILQKHPGLRELDLNDDAMLQLDSSETPVPFVLSQLVDLKLCVVVNAVKKILVAYYECKGLDYTRKADYLAVSSRVDRRHPLVFVAQSRSAPTPTSQSTLELGFSRTDELFELLPLFPLDNVQDFTAEGLNLSSDEYYTMLQMTENLLPSTCSVKYRASAGNDGFSR
ncbi:hypothetical protein BDM02DRAFT_3261806 [Thelephora ganbajun]|uniref:Uncharacterized protein n=1 Tax=Thelephora ganbajun TaxID=370292 RepID=A0ACB6ZCC9_THEGA|nr:hypothetical protein BDM02DRAFT_3261806 [Thelephora ganbajun]